MKVSKFDWLWEMLAPRHCEVCSKYIGQNTQRHEFICDSCFDSIPLAPPPDVIFTSMINNFSFDDLSIIRFYSLFSVKKGNRFMNLIYGLKYLGFTRVGFEIGHELGKVIEMYSDIEYDALIPVPIHHARIRERGFNQADIICKGISDYLGMPVKNKTIKRDKYTTSQTKLSKEERKYNVKDIFKPYNKRIKLNGGTFLLVDDVLTTGSTINSAAEALLEMGANRVDAATLAKA
jgi:ComF family protein